MPFSSITIAELRQLLQDYDDEQMVTFVSDYGDHCHTQQVHSLNGQIEELSVGRSGYSDSGYAVVDERFAQGGEQKILVIS